MSLRRGSCLCGDVRYEITAEPIALYCCHCSECQTTSGSSFVLALRVPYGAIQIIKGDARVDLRPEADGQPRHVGRCPRCYTALWSERVESPQFQTVYAGTLENSTHLRPVAHIWTQDAQPWISFPDDTLRFAQNAPDMQMIFDAWKNRPSAAGGECGE